MRRATRRRAARLVGAVVAGSIAGCLDAASDPGGTSADGNGADDGGDASDERDADGADSNDTAVDDPDGGAEPGPPDGAIVDGSEVNYPAFVDDAASVVGTDERIEYDDPESSFDLLAGYGGDEASDDELRIGRDLSGDAMTAFVAPVYDGGFEYHVFANGAFVEFADWRAISLDDDGPVDDRAAAFVEVTEGAYYLRVTPSIDEAGVAVVDAPPGRAAEADDELTGIAAVRTDGADRANVVPRVTFAFERDPAAGTVRISVTSGDSVRGDHLSVVVGDERIPNPFGVETVRAGDTASIEAPAGAAVRIVYDDGERSATLATDEP